MSTPQDPYATGPGDQPSTGSSPQPPSYGSAPQAPSYGSAPQSPYTGDPAPGSYGGAGQGYSGQGYSGQGPEGYGGQGAYGQQPRNGLGVTALVLGIIALLFCWTVIAGVLGLVGLVLGIIGMGRAKRGQATNRGVALAGTILSALALVAAIAFGILYATLGIGLYQDNQECFDPSLSQAEAEQCLNENLGVTG